MENRTSVGRTGKEVKGWGMGVKSWGVKREGSLVLCPLCVCFVFLSCFFSFPISGALMCFEAHFPIVLCLSCVCVWNLDGISWVEPRTLCRQWIAECVL